MVKARDGKENEEDEVDEEEEIDDRTPEQKDKDAAYAALVEAEIEDGMDERRARALALDEEIIDQIVQDAVSGSAYDPNEVTWPPPGADTDDDDEEGLVEMPEPVEAKLVATGAVYDIKSLCDKYGGVDQVYEDHVRTSEEGLFPEEGLEEVKCWLYDYVQNHTLEARKCFAKFDYKGGGQLTLVGTSHLSRASTEFVVDTVREQRPDCLLIERRLGDDSLQRLTIPEQLYQEIVMTKAPSDIFSTDTSVDRVRKFHEDRVWLEGTPGWKNIGAEAALSQEFGAAVEEFARQREESPDDPELGLRGGTICFGDADLRTASSLTKADRMFKPALSDFSKEGPNVPLRDLILAQALRGALKTHKRVVGIVGKDHLEGITKLLKQDPRINVTYVGIQIAQPMWQRDLMDGGKKWARAASAPNSMFARLANAIQVFPLGTYLSAEAVAELMRDRRATEKILETEGPVADPVAPASSAIAESLFERDLAFSPESAEELESWLRRETAGDSFAGYFPFENPAQRKKARLKASAA